MKILFGVCGIANGHLYRQLPLIKHYALDNTIMIFSYGNALAQLKKEFKNYNNIQIAEVSVMYLPGNKQGLDFSAALKINTNSSMLLNLKAYSACQKFLGKPDLVITDYEPVAASYGYSYQAPVVTIDQQHKYFLPSCPENIGTTNALDEKMRLSMFFPKAELRLACSFFYLPNTNANINIIAPIMDESIYTTESVKTDEILVYRSSQNLNTQTLAKWISILKKVKAEKFTIVTHEVLQKTQDSNLTLLPYGQNIIKMLANSKALIANAGHSLLSEATYLNIPALVVPLSLFEQQFSAKIIQDNSFGVNTPLLTTTTIRQFINNLDKFENNLKNDTTIILRSNGKNQAVSKIKEVL